MKKSWKAISSLLLALAMVMGISVTAAAADSSVTFLGQAEGFEFKPGSTYTSTDLFDGFKGVMPGDKLTEEISVTNQADDCDYIKLYMRAEAHDEESNPLSPNVAASGETVATMSDFLAQLHMKVYNEGTLIFDASPDQTDGLTENVLLGTFRKGDFTTLTVELDVPTSLGNDFAYFVGEVDWVFTTEGLNDPPKTRDLTVRKVWDDRSDTSKHQQVDVNLLRNGKVYETVTLDEQNDWTYTFDGLEKDGVSWNVAEANIPDGYVAKYTVSGDTVTITNVEQDASQVDVTVKKTWNDNKGKGRPSSVVVTLYNGKKAVKSVNLNAGNDWTHTWKNLDGNGNWKVVEVSVPKGYTPYYNQKGDQITITNTATLIQTGQLNWPILVLGSLGAVLVICGVLFTVKKRKQDRA